jgi:hypothetical protein
LEGCGQSLSRQSKFRNFSCFSSRLNELLLDSVLLKLLANLTTPPFSPHLPTNALRKPAETSKVLRVVSRKMLPPRYSYRQLFSSCKQSFYIKFFPSSTFSPHFVKRSTWYILRDLRSEIQHFSCRCLCVIQ